MEAKNVGREGFVRNIGSCTSARHCKMCQSAARRNHGPIQIAIFELLFTESSPGFYFCFFVMMRPRSGRNSFTTLNPILLAIVMPKLTAPFPAEP